MGSRKEKYSQKTLQKQMLAKKMLQLFFQNILVESGWLLQC